MLDKTKLTVIKSWDDKEYTVADILEACDDADQDSNSSLDEYFDGDLATIPALVRGLCLEIDRLNTIKE